MAIIHDARRHINGIHKRPEAPKKFKVNPLDINLSKMQFNLLSRCEREVPEHGDFAPVSEKYCSKDPTRKLDESKLTCRFIKDDESPKDDKRILEAIFSDKETKQEYTTVLCRGTKKEILEYLKGSELFNQCKEIIEENEL